MRALVLAVAGSISALSGQQQLADLNPFYDDPSSVPGPYVPFASGVVFAASTVSLGRELWFLPRGSTSASLIADLAPGPADANPEHLASTGATLFFTADDGAGQALFVTDGTGVGTRRLRALTVAPALSTAQFVAMGSQVFAIADDGVGGPELWRSDGTVAGTQLVVELEPGAAGCLLVSAVEFGSELFLAVRTPHTAPTRTLLVRTDGTAAGTSVVTNTDQGGPQVALPLVASGGVVFFGGSPPSVNDFELWRTDGTANGTRQILDLDPLNSSYVGSMIPFGTGVAYLARVSSYGDEPVISDGTAIGTMIIDVNRLVGRGSAPTYLTQMQGDLYLLANTINGSGLVRIDGNQRTVAFLRQLSWQTTLRPQLVATQSRLFLRALEPTAQGRTAAQLFVSDATVAGTLALADLRPGLGDSRFDHLTVVGSDVVFTNDDGTFGAEPWHSDGTPAGTGLAANVAMSGSTTGRGSDPTFMQRAGLVTVFDADDGDRGREPFVTRGTPGDVQRLVDLVPGALGSRLTPVGTTALGAAFASTPGNAGALATDYFITDGSAVGTRRLQTPLLLGAPLASTVAPDRDRAIAFAAAWLLPQGVGIQGHALLHVVGDSMALLAPSLPLSTLPPRDAVMVGGRMFFAAGSSSTGYEPWTASGAIVDLRQGALGSDAGASLKAALRGVCVFSADDGVSGVELWRSDGTAAGTRQVADLAPGSSSSTPRSPCAIGDRMFFVADGPGVGAELYLTDGSASGTRLVADLWPGPNGSVPTGLIAHHGGVYFAADDGSSGRELWFSDGSAAGTRRVADLRPGAASSDPRALTVLGTRRVLFVASELAEGDEPWVSDGTAIGTTRLSAVRPGPLGSGVTAFEVRPDGRVLFVADDGRSGREPWVFDPGAVAVRLGYPCGVATASLTATDPLLGASLRIDCAHDSGGILAGVLLLSLPIQTVFEGCALFADPSQLSVPLAMPAGAFRVDLFVPNAARFVGIVLHTQALVGLFAAPPGWALSNAMALRLGR